MCMCSAQLGGLGMGGVVMEHTDFAWSLKVLHMKLKVTFSNFAACWLSGSGSTISRCDTFDKAGDLTIVSQPSMFSVL